MFEGRNRSIVTRDGRDRGRAGRLGAGRRMAGAAGRDRRRDRRRHGLGHDPQAASRRPGGPRAGRRAGGAADRERRYHAGGDHRRSPAPPGWCGPTAGCPSGARRHPRIREPRLSSLRRPAWLRAALRPPGAPTAASRRGARARRRSPTAPPPPGRRPDGPGTPARDRRRGRPARPRPAAAGPAGGISSRARSTASGLVAPITAPTLESPDSPTSVGAPAGHQLGRALPHRPAVGQPLLLQVGGRPGSTSAPARTGRRRRRRRARNGSSESPPMYGFTVIASATGGPPSRGASQASA